MGIQLAPIEGTPYAGGTATGIIYLDTNGLQRSDGPTVDASGNVTVGGNISATAQAITGTPLVVNGTAGQTGDLIQVTSSSGTAGGLFRIESGGRVGVNHGSDVLPSNVTLSVVGNISASAAGGGGAVSTLMNTAPDATIPSILPLRGDANTGIGRSGNDELSMIAGAVEGIRITGYGKILMHQGNISSATADDVMMSIAYTTNKATSGSDTGVLISKTDTASPGASLFIDAHVGGVSKFSVGDEGDITASGDLTLSSPTVPASASATGTAGTVSWDADYIYICTATDTWKRVAISTW